MTPDELKGKIEELAPKTTVEVQDLTGTQNHYQASIVSPIFSGKSTIERHRLVNEILSTELNSGEVHALTLKTLTPEEKKT